MNHSREVQSQAPRDEPAQDRQADRGDERFTDPVSLARHWDVHPNTVYRDIRKGALPALRMPGGRLRIRWSDARRYGRPVD